MYTIIYTVCKYFTVGNNNLVWAQRWTLQLRTFLDGLLACCKPRRCSSPQISHDVVAPNAVGTAYNSDGACSGLG